MIYWSAVGLVNIMLLLVRWLLVAGKIASVGDLREKILSAHVFDDLQEALTHTVGFAAVKTFGVDVFSHINPVQFTIVILMHNNAILVIVRFRLIAAIIFPDIIRELVCISVIQVSHFIVWEILNGHDVIFIFNSVIKLVEAKVSILGTESGDNFPIAEFYIFTSKPVEQIEAMSGLWLTEA